MTKRELRNIATALPAAIIILFYWWATATGFEWQGSSLDDMWVAFFVTLGGATIAVIAISYPFAALYFRIKNNRKTKIERKDNTA